MQIDVRHASHPEAVRGYDTETLRRHFLVETIFEGGEIRLTYSHYDRMVIGGATPLGTVLTLTAPTAIGQETFLAERELGALNIGGAGRIIVDGTSYDLAKYDCLYAGKGAKDVRFESADAANPAKFYLVSTPAHQTHPTVLLTREKARHLTPGEAATANKRSIYQFIHPEVCQSCQLTLGFTMIEPGSVWNTMPAHTHDRRMEAYLYFDLEAEQRVFPLHGRAAADPAYARRQRAGGHLAALVDPFWRRHQELQASSGRWAATTRASPTWTISPLRI